MRFHDFTGKVGVMTGAAGLICSGCAKEFAACGGKAAILDIDEEKAKRLAFEITQAGGEAVGVKADVLSKESLKLAHETVLHTLGPCDILLNGAGGNHPSATCDEEFFSMETWKDEGKKSFFDLDLDGFKRVFDLNFIGTLLPVQEFAQDMVKKQSGVIVNIASVNAVLPLTKIPAYSGAKAGIANFTQYLAVYFAKFGIRVNAAAFGFFSSAQNAKLLWNEDGTPTKRTEKILLGTPMGRLGVQEEAAGPLLWLFDDAQAGFVTGAVVPVDGGFTAYSGV